MGFIVPILGLLVGDMGSSIGDALFTKAQQKVLALCFGQPDKSFYLNEVVRRADMGRGAISRELSNLVAAGVLQLNKQGNQNHYQANPDCPIFDEIVSIVKKTFGIKAVVKSALVTLLPKLEQAFIYGSVAKGEEHANSDVDVMLVGDDLSYTEIMALLAPVESQLQRAVNPTIYSVEEFTQRLTQNQGFLSKVMAQPKIDLLTDTQ